MKLTKEQARLALEGMNALTMRGGIDLNTSQAVLAFAGQLQDYIQSQPEAEPPPKSNGARETRPKTSAARK